MTQSERGSAVVGSIFGMVMLLFLALGTIQVALTLYARNVVQAAVHDGSRAVVEIGADGSDANAVARAAIQRAAGSLVEDLSVATSSAQTSERLLVRVSAAGKLVAPGPIPVVLPITVESTSTREVFDGDR